MATITKEEKILLLESVPVHKAILRLIVPTIMSQLVAMVYNFADAFFVGRLGDPNQIAALSLIFPLYMMTTLLGNLFGIGGNSVVSRSLGERDYAKVKHASAFSIYSCIVTALLFSVILHPHLEQILYFIGASDNTVGYACDYLMIVLVLGAVPTSLQLTISHLIRAEGASRQAGIGIMLGGVLNIILDPIFMFGVGMGFTGAAVATLISNVISLLYFVVVIIRMRGNSFLSYHFRDYRLRSGADIIPNGAAAAMQILFGSTANIVMTATASGYGDLAVASFGILQKYTTMAICIAIGIGQGVSPLLGYNYTARNYQRIREASRIIIIGDAAFALAFFVAIEAFPLFFASILTTDPAAAKAAAGFLRLGYIGIGGTVLMNFFISAYQAYGAWRSNFIMNFVRQIVVYVPNIIIMSHLWGVNGLALSYSVSEILSFLIALFVYRRLMRCIRGELV